MKINAPCENGYIKCILSISDKLLQVGFTNAADGIDVRCRKVEKRRQYSTR